MAKSDQMYSGSVFSLKLNLYFFVIKLIVWVIIKAFSLFSPQLGYCFVEHFLMFK